MNENLDDACQGEKELVDLLLGLPEDSSVIFDFDGTLAYTEDIHWRLFHDELEKMFGIDYPFSEHWKVTGKSYTQIWEELGARYGFDGTTEEVLARKEEMLSIDTGVKLAELGRKCYPYVRRAVDAAIDARARLFCVSANTTASIATSLNDWGLLERFSGIYSSSPLKEDKVSAIAAIAAATSGMAVVLDDGLAVVERLSSLDGMTIVGAGHPQSFDRLAQSGKCDVLLDLRGWCPQP